MSINRDDLFRDKFRTSDGPLTGSVLYSLSLPDDLGYIAQVADALYAMCIEENWEKAGTVTVDEATQAAIEVLWSFRPMVGTIFPVLWDTIPDNYLLCDGASYLRVDYPVLYSNLPAAFIVDADNFVVPDLQGRSIVGAGSGSGLTTRVPGDTGGEEDHTLVGSEVPSHTHTEITATATAIMVGAGAPAPSAIPGIGVTGSSGADGTHNNMQPFSVLTFVIVAR